MNKEQVTFAGIPIPLTMETLLDAMDASWEDYYHNQDERKMRQFNAFRERILRVDAEKDEELNHLRKYRNMELTRDLEKWSKKHLKKKDELAAKDARIAELYETGGDLFEVLDSLIVQLDKKGEVDENYLNDAKLIRDKVSEREKP